MIKNDIVETVFEPDFLQPTNWTGHCLIMFAAILVMAACWLFYQAWLERDRILTPDEVLAEKEAVLLAMLKKQDLNSTAKEFYFLLIFILKWYLAQTTNISLENKTDSEAKKYLQSHDLLEPEELSFLLALFDHAFQTRFAGLAQELVTMEKDLALSFAIIKKLHLRYKMMVSNLKKANI